LGVNLATSATIRPTASSEELYLANELMAKVHSDDYASTMRWLLRHASAYPGLPPEHTRIAILDGKIAGALRLTTETMRVGDARLKVAGLGLVTTAPEFRHRGVCTELLRETQRYMLGHGYHVSMLFGIPNFYHRFGYATTLADYTISLDVTEVPSVLSGTYKVRAAKPGDIGAIQKIHASNDAEVSCSLLRSSAHLKFKWDRFSPAMVFTTQQGRVVAYVLMRQTEGGSTVEDVGVADLSVAPDVLAYCAGRAQDAFCPRIRFLLPPENPLAHYLARFQSVHEMRISRDRGGMMAFVDLGEALESMLPEWEARVVDTPAEHGRSEVTLLVDGRTYRVRSTHGSLDVAQAPGRHKFSVSRMDLMHLLTGYAHFEDIFCSERRMLPTGSRELLAALFPKRSPCVHPFDQF